MAVSIIGPGWDSACFLSCTAVTSFRYGPSGSPNDFKSLSVSNIRASKSICSSLNFCMYCESPQAVRKRSRDEYPDSSTSASSSEVMVELPEKIREIVLLIGTVDR